MKIEELTVKKIAEFAEKSENEICGFIIFENDQEKVIYINNSAEDKQNFFVIDPEDFWRYRKIIKAVFHSHVSINEEPSDFDRKTCWQNQIPFVIYSVKTKQVKILLPEECYF